MWTFLDCLWGEVQMNGSFWLDYKLTRICWIDAWKVSDAFLLWQKKMFSFLSLVIITSHPHFPDIMVLWHLLEQPFWPWLSVSIIPWAASSEWTWSLAMSIVTYYYCHAISIRSDSMKHSPKIPSSTHSQKTLQKEIQLGWKNPWELWLWMV